MKERQERPDSLIRTLWMCAVLLLAAGCATQVPVVNGGGASARVIHQKGVARYKTGSSDWQLLKVGDQVNPGTTIQTATNSQLDLVLGYGSAPGARPATSQRNTVRLGENTILSVDKLAVMETGADLAMETQLDLRTGRVYGVLNRPSAGSKYEVKLPDGVAVIRGTAYDISAEGEVKVSSGSVSKQPGHQM